MKSHRLALRYPRAFAIALAANTLIFLSFQASFPVLPDFIAEAVVKRPPDAVGGQVGLAMTVLALVSVATRIPAGQLADRLSRQRFMLLGASCFTLAPLIYAFSQSMPPLLLGRVVHGLGMGTFTTAFQALVADLMPAERRGEALGLAGASTSLAFVGAPLLGDWFSDTWGYRAFFLASTAAAGLSILLAALIREPTGRKANRPASSPPGLRLVLAQRGMHAGVLSMAALGVPFGAFISFLPLFALDRQIEGVGIVFSVYALTILLTQPLAGWLSDRLGRRGVLLPGLALVSLATLIICLDCSLRGFILAGSVFGLGGGLARGGIDALVQDSVPSDLRGTAAAVQYTSFDFWIGLGSYPIGLLANATGYGLTFALTGIFCLTGDGALIVMLRNRAEPTFEVGEVRRDENDHL